ncbi:cytochrome c biogenesis CcdA family protein [sulfur-oxidizing endosymbiont of Gigantopelta aegis]|uniref:cytochrome c biogenesis CcdA family protein n=1 Tax=sulfur-oxidizing endosymbiont of Gigantopelta aegis TaxID=2794934 RepID=UPI0031B639EC
MITLLLLSATLLGLLAFFEPCTIATHTLFSVRVNQANDRQAYYDLFLVWLSRTLLLIGLLTLAVILIEPPQWGIYTPSIILSIMAMVYVISRFTYIPVPHLEFFKLLPGAQNLPFSLQLGLTLPACTLPLVVVTMGMAVTVNSIGFAILSGFLFATLFTLPLFITAYKGVHDETKQLLNQAAKSSPYLTALLLLGTALYLLMPSMNITAEALKQTLQTASWAGIGLSFMAGLVFSFNPVSFASVPVMLAYVTKAHEPKRAVLMGGAFVFGMLTTHVVLGVAAALGGEWVQSIMGRQWGLLLGPVLIIMGLMWSGLINIRLPWFGVKGRKVTGIWGAFLLAIPFSVAVCPFCTPALLVTLTASAAIGSVSFGFVLLLAFALGRSIPIILGAWSMGWLESLQVLSRHQKIFEISAGVVLILAGFYMLNEYFLLIEY